MKTGFAMLIPFIGILSILAVQQVAIRTAPVTTATAVVYAPTGEEVTVAVDSSLYVTPEELGKVRGELRFVAKGGLDSAKKKGQKVTDELDTYLLSLDKQIDSKKQQIADKEKLLSELKAANSAISKPVVTTPKVTQVPVKKPKQPSQEEDDENY